MDRRKFIATFGGLTATTLIMKNLDSLASTAALWEDTDKPMPAIFIGHGAPLYALDENKFSLAWRKIGKSIPKPRAIVSVSAHWLTPGKTLVTAAPRPRTIHDFGRMDDRLFEMQYPAPGDPVLAEEIAQTVKTVPIATEHNWGYDHGTWCVLYHMFPDADIPVIQLSIDYRQGAQYHFNLAKQLQFLRKKGVLVMGSGNIVHNLRELNWTESTSYDWAVEFDETSKALMDKGDFVSLINYEKLGRAARLSIPTPDHYFPLMYVLGLKTEQDSLRYPVDGVTYGSTSMRSVIIG